MAEALYGSGALHAYAPPQKDTPQKSHNVVV